MTPTRLAPLLGTRWLTAAALAGVMAFPALKLAAQGKPTIDQFLKPGLPLEIISAKKVDRIAWISTERGQRNVHTAGAPDFVPVRLTKFLKDDGVPVRRLSMSDGCGIVTSVPGKRPAGRGWHAHANSHPRGAARAI